MFRNICVVTLLYLVFVAGQDIVPDDPEVQKEMHQMFYKARVACADENLVPYVKICSLFALLNLSLALQDQAKDNGDVFIISYDSFDGDVDDISTTTPAPKEADYVDFDEVVHNCNASFITPMSNVLTFNSTGALPDETDKTSMCYFHCFFEKSGLMKDYKLNADLVRKYVWPATGDSLEVCENEAKEETNACERGYAIVKCVFIRSLTDARNKPTV
ncbi:Odorant-binding protein 84a, isoform A [Drosophila ananassae]|uniref:Odorant-binding protein 84a, isoform A n=1 Tax=Drosophila ananassae TaxID=7217 RepID=B3LYF5_DROAN|nr:general odorant-binding protein 84a isoform X2 [Drosophila ananassae]EDV41818.2 Odorant-binding protein 84a, isoform A [Drosophila ananassae]